MKTDTLVDFYKVNDSDHPIKLTVQIGCGKNSVSKIILNNQMLPGPERDGSFIRSFEKILGTNKELKGKKLQMTTLVLDLMEKSTGTSLIISITGGVTQYAQKLETKMHEKGGVVKYSVDIRFFK